ncbi:MAG: translation initiation factor IF-2 [Phycisphaerales bacterium]
MAKKALRVHQLAKQLNVSSKDIVSKCEAESIPGITNHMSAVSLGLAATITEWFGDAGDGGTATAVETAPPVDVEAVRKRAAKKKAAPRKAKAAETPADAPAEAVVEAPAEPATPVAAAPAAPPADAPPASAPPASAPEAPAPGAADPPATDAPAAPSAPAAAPKPISAPKVIPVTPAASAPAAPGTPSPAPVPSAAPGAAPGSVPPGAAPSVAASADEDSPQQNVPDRPKVITPAGPILSRPKETKLAGPKVVRIEAPEPDRPPRTRRPDGPMRGGPRGGRGAGVAPMEMPPMPGERGPGGGVGGGASRRNKRRSTTTTGRPEGRTGRAAVGGGGAKPFNWREQDLRERELRIQRASGLIRGARRDSQKKSGGGHRATSAAQTGGAVTVQEPITIKGLSLATGVKVNDIIRRMVKLGLPMSMPDSVIEGEMAQEIMLEWSIELEVIEFKTAEEQIAESFEQRAMVNEQSRSPVVTILGHVDHGKTTLLDTIRKANVAGGEAGGITQATSAFRVPVQIGEDAKEGGRVITFIDTPGHEAFTEMRSRGAKVTDVVVLVVAADDGVMPQTIESINHAKAAEVPIIVALNKIDKPEATEANITRILGQLAEQGLNPTEWGGSTEVIRIAALKGEGIQDLLEVLDLQAQILELTADFGGRSEGTVIEAQLVEGRGPVARILVQQGKLKKGDYVVIGRAYGRVRDIVDDRGQRVKEAEPSFPIAISGINEVPDAGDKFYVVKNQREAEAAAGERKHQEREKSLATEKVTLDNIFDHLKTQGRKELPLIVKADVQGSLETLRAQLPKIGSEEVATVIKHAAVGGVNEADIQLAEASGAIIVGFNVTAPGRARKLAEQKGVELRFYDVIYDLTDDVTQAAEGLLEPELKLEVLGHAEVKQVFKISKVGSVAGCYVTDGVIRRDAQIRVTRDNIVIEKDRRLVVLKRFKDEAKEVNAGQECGMRIDGYDDIREGDVLECYLTKEVRRTLNG